MTSFHAILFFLSHQLAVGLHSLIVINRVGSGHDARVIIKEIDIKVVHITCLEKIDHHRDHQISKRWRFTHDVQPAIRLDTLFQQLGNFGHEATLELFAQFLELNGILALKSRIRC